MDRAVPPADHDSDREPLSGQVEKVVFHNPESGFAVLRVRLRGRGEPATVVGLTPSIAAGEQPSFRLPTLVEDAEYAVEAAVLGEADVVRLQRRLDELERRLQTVEERLPRRVYRKLTRTAKRVLGDH